MFNIITAATSIATPFVYAGFVAIVLALLALDLGVFHRKAHAPSMRESIGWTLFWIAIAIAFGGAVFVLYDNHFFGLGEAVPVVGAPHEAITLSGVDAGSIYFTAYLLEKSLSMDNVFVIAMIFTSLGINPAYQHRVLFWGIVGALVMRGVMIALGAALIAAFSWTVYAFGALLIIAALKMAFTKEEAHDVRQSRLVRLLSKAFPISPDLDGQKLISRIGGRWHGTPLLVALIVIEAADLMFAVDSIPAVFALTADPFIVFTSNIMAILGLRSLYFCLAAAMTHFRFLKTALVGVLLFVGIKMCLVHTELKIPTEIALSVILGLLISGVAASILVGRAEARKASSEPSPEPEPAHELIANHLAERPSISAPIADSPMPAAPGYWRRFLEIWRSNTFLRRTVVLLAGAAVIGTGLILSPIPGPQLTILGPLGLGIWASEFLWARRIAGRLAKQEHGVRGVIDRFLINYSRVWIIPIVLWFWISAWLLSEYSPAPPWILWTLAFPIFTPVCYVIYRWWKVRKARAVNH